MTANQKPSNLLTRNLLTIKKHARYLVRQYYFED